MVASSLQHPWSSKQLQLQPPQAWTLAFLAACQAKMPLFNVGQGHGVTSGPKCALQRCMASSTMYLISEVLGGLPVEHAQCIAISLQRTLHLPNRIHSLCCLRYVVRPLRMHCSSRVAGARNAYIDLCCLCFAGPLPSPAGKCSC